MFWFDGVCACIMVERSGPWVKTMKKARQRMSLAGFEVN